MSERILLDDDAACCDATAAWLLVGVDGLSCANLSLLTAMTGRTATDGGPARLTDCLVMELVRDVAVVVVVSGVFVTMTGPS